MPFPFWLVGWGGGGDGPEGPGKLVIPIIYHIGVSIFSKPQVKISRQQPWGCDWDGLKEQRTMVEMCFALKSDTCDHNLTKTETIIFTNP